MLFWKIFTIYFALSTLYFELAPGSLNAWDFLDLLILLISILGLIGFSFNRAIFRPLFWKLYLPLNILWNMWHPDSTTVPGVPGVPFGVVLAIGITAAVPFYIAMFLYGFRRKQLWRGSSTNQSY